MIQRFLMVLCLLSSLHRVYGQSTLPVDESLIAKKAPFLNLAFNRILNDQSLYTFFEKLYRLSNTDTVINIVQIGDSHTQPDFISSVMRMQLQQQLGDAGRGIVFPYQLASSNAPTGLQSNSNVRWKFSRLANPAVNTQYGIAGFEINTDLPQANVSMSWADSLVSFDGIKVFSDSQTQWQVPIPGEMPLLPLATEQGISQFNFNQPVRSFTLQSQVSGFSKKLYGISLEKNRPGIRYHNIGVNGAQYKQYNANDLFWQQLNALKPDAIIVSLGTNEAQKANLNIDSFQLEVQAFIDHVKQIAPDAGIILTTPGNSLRGGRSNPMITQVNIGLNAFCMDHQIALWDFYKVGGRTPAAWIKKGWMAKDNLHFNREGYLFQGQLLYAAFAKAYNGYVQHILQAN